MKSIFVCAVLLALGMSCLADRAEWQAFQDEMKAGVCKPDTMDDAQLTALIACKEGAIDEEKMKKMKEMGDKVYEKCGTPNEGDISAYTKVTTADNKKFLMHYCSDNMMKCIKEMMDEWQKNNAGKGKGGGGGGGRGGGGGGKMSDEQKTTLQTCMKTAVGLA